MIRNILLTTMILGGILAGCSEDDLRTYDGTDSVYWGMKSGLSQTTTEYSDSTYFSFISVPDRRDTILSLKVELLGNVESYDRYFRVMVIPEKTNAPDVNYELEGIRFKIPADSIWGTVPLRLHYTKELLEKTYRICIKLLPGEDLDVAIEKKVLDKNKGRYVDLLQHTLLFDCQLKKPGRWLEEGELAFLGYFTPLKYLEMTKYFTLNDELWVNMEPGTLSAMAVYMASKVKKAYDSDPVTLKNSPKEADGKLMWFPINKANGQLPESLYYQPKKK